MAKKNVTIDQLAVMIGKSFDSTDKKISNGFKGVGGRLDKVVWIRLKTV